MHDQQCPTGTPARVFPVTVICGASKPSDLSFLLDTVQELKAVIDSGVDFGSQHLNVSLKCVVCDAPAKAQVKGTIQCIGYYGCDKCTLGGD